MSKPRKQYDPMNIGSLLRQIRHDCGFTLKDVVAYSDFKNSSHLSRIERSECETSCESFFSLLRFYEVDFIVFGLNNPTDVPATLSKLRANRCLSYKDLERYDGRSKTFYRYSELGKQSPPITGYLKLLAFYGYNKIRIGNYYV